MADDLISRDAVIDLISNFILEIHSEGGRDLNAHTNDVLRQILRNVKSDRVLPSVNPQEPIYYPPCEDCHNKMDEIRKAYDKVQSAEPKTGHWEWLTEDKYRCSNCNHETRVDECMNEPMYSFCPFCGAKMVEPQESEDKE